MDDQLTTILLYRQRNDLGLYIACTDRFDICVCMKDPNLQPITRTIFSDLVQQVDAAPPAGSVYSRERDGITYLYAKIPVGNDRIDRFIGKQGDEEAEAEAASLRLGADLAKKRRDIVSMLKRDRLAGPDRTLGAALDAIAYAGLFRAGAVLVGTAAYMMFEPLVGRRLPAPTLMTGDLDLATARLALTAEPPEGMERILKRADRTFTPIPSLRPGAPPSRFRNAEGYLVDLLTPVRSRADRNPMSLVGLEAGAVPLHYLGWLIEDPVPTVALWGAGIAVNVPQPARFAVHKLILAQRRDQANRHKRMKDLDQARALIEVLRDHDRFALADAVSDARSRGRKGWAEHIDRSLNELGLSDSIDE
ncbi:GSU2403 family nucleotidyltransferase fold protein [Rhizorhabdus sp. FW153]|uniref:GSU2403 family nucleotidyltransferase fold protein n=1 Tax=Rhizorhabdus sp. FW153 TaxID=3400216 RepID=UPI003CEB67D2